MEVNGQPDVPAALPNRERAPNIHWIGGWVDPRANLDMVLRRKIPSPCRESNTDHLIVQPVASCITNIRSSWVQEVDNMPIRMQLRAML
jgi:hypothetical protein